MLSSFLFTLGCGGSAPSQQSLIEQARRRKEAQLAAGEIPPGSEEEKAAEAEAEAAKQKRTIQPRVKSKIRPAKRTTSSSAKAAEKEESADDKKSAEKQEADGNGAEKAGSDGPDEATSGDEAVQRSIKNLKTIGQAILKYVDQHGAYPARREVRRRPSLSWRVSILPQLGYQQLFEKFKLDEPWDSPHNKKLLSEIPPVYQAPDRPDEKTNYLSLDGLLLGTEVEQSPDRMARDGVDATIAVVEADNAVEWTKPESLHVVPSEPNRGLTQRRKAGFLALMADGKVRLIKHGTHIRELLNLFSYRGDDRVELPSHPIATLDLVQGRAKAASAQQSPSGDPAQVAGTGAPAQSSPSAASGNDRRNSKTDVDPLANPSANFLAASDEAMALGRERDAMMYFYAHALTSDPADPWVDQMKWIPGLSRPGVVIRWGVGIEFRGPPNRADRANDPDSAINDLAEDVGQGALRELEVRAARGWFGSLTDPRRIGKSNRRSRLRRGRGSKFEPTLMSPSITFLGVGNTTRQIFILADEQQVDFILVMEVDVRSAARSDVESSDIRLELYDGRSHQTISGYRSVKVNTIKLERARKDPTLVNPLEEAIEAHEEYLDENCRLSPLPEMKPEHAAGRVQALQSGRYENPLPILTEIRYYYLKDLIPLNQLLAAFQQILGEQQGADLAAGKYDDRVEVLKPWLPDEDHFVLQDFRRR